MGFVAPAGTRLSFGDFVFGGLRAFSADPLSDLKSGLCRLAGCDRAWLFSTGRAAMSLAFEAMKVVARDEARLEVIVPGYTCYSVPAAVERAGLVPRLCDVDPSTLTADLRSLADIDPRRVLAIVSANLYGLPNALDEIQGYARSHGIFMLDDAAQALGADFRGRAVGGFGDVGLYSFDKGKNITTLHGGALVANSGPLTAAIEDLAVRLPAPGGVTTIGTLAKLPAYAVLLHPALYAGVRRLPLGLGLTPYETDFPVRRFSRTVAGLAARQLDSLGRINASRIGHAGRLRAALSGARGLQLPSVLDGAAPVYARCPVLIEQRFRASVIAALERSGIGATASYPKALIDVPEVARRLPADQRPTPGARDLASRIMTLPTHGYVPANLAERVVSITRTVLRDA